MKLGAFSLSINVKDLKASKIFYEKLGFEKFGGDESNNYLVMKNGDTLIGLYQGMFESNMLTFNPGWDQNAQNMEKFDDVRDIHQSLKSTGMDIEDINTEEKSGPAYFSITDPDGNVILLDQHR